MTRKLSTLAAGVAILALPPVASADFIVEDDPEEGNSWTQRIVIGGTVDYIAFEFLSGSGGPFELPGLTNFESTDGTPLGGWSNAGDSTSTLVAAGGPDTSGFAFTINFEGNMTDPVSFRGVAFLDGEFQFSADFTWEGSTGFGFGDMTVENNDAWDPDPTSLPAVVVPLPAPVWLGAAGLGAVLLLRRRFT